MTRSDHKPGQLDCPMCEGPCLVVPTIDDANTALAVARDIRERIAACDAMSLAIRRERERLTQALARPTPVKRYRAQGAIP